MRIRPLSQITYICPVVSSVPFNTNKGEIRKICFCQQLEAPLFVDSNLQTNPKNTVIPIEAMKTHLQAVVANRERGTGGSSLSLAVSFWKEGISRRMNVKARYEYVSKWERPRKVVFLSAALEARLKSRLNRDSYAVHPQILGLARGLLAEMGCSITNDFQFFQRGVKISSLFHGGA